MIKNEIKDDIITTINVIITIILQHEQHCFY